MIATIRADQLRPGMTLSTDGSTIAAVVLCQSPDLEDEICIQRVWDDRQKFDYVAPSLPVHVWTAA